MMMIGGEGPIVWVVLDWGFCLGIHDRILEDEAGRFILELSICRLSMVGFISCGLE